MEKNLPFAKYWIQVFKKTTSTAFGIISIFFLVATIILGIISTYHPEWENWVIVLSRVLPLAIFIILFVPVAMVQSHLLYKQKADKVDENETQAIDLEANCIYESRRGIWVARVGIKAVGLKAVRSIFIYLRYIDGVQNDLFDAPLHPAGRLRNTTGAINVNPGNTQMFVEVLHWNPGVEMGIPYNYNYQLTDAGVNIHESPHSLPDNVDVGSHKLILYATGEDIEPVEREFTVEIKDEELTFCRV
jgi:hypothetical protein